MRSLIGAIIGCSHGGSATAMASCGSALSARHLRGVAGNRTSLQATAACNRRSCRTTAGLDKQSRRERVSGHMPHPDRDGNATLFSPGEVLVVHPFRLIVAANSLTPREQGLNAT